MNKNKRIITDADGVLTGSMLLTFDAVVGFEPEGVYLIQNTTWLSDMVIQKVKVLIQAV